MALLDELIKLNNSDGGDGGNGGRASRTKGFSLPPSQNTMVEMVEANPNIHPLHSEATEPFNQAAMDKVKAGYPVKVWSGILQEWLIWVRGETERNKLIKKGSTLPIYTLGELAVVAKMSGEDLRNIHQMKKTFTATIES